VVIVRRADWDRPLARCIGQSSPAILVLLSENTFAICGPLRKEFSKPLRQTQNKAN